MALLLGHMLGVLGTTAQLCLPDSSQTSLPGHHQAHTWARQHRLQHHNTAPVNKGPRIRHALLPSRGSTQLCTALVKNDANQARECKRNTPSLWQKRAWGTSSQPAQQNDTARPAKAVQGPWFTNVCMPRSTTTVPLLIAANNAANSTKAMGVARTGSLAYTLLLPLVL